MRDDDSTQVSVVIDPQTDLFQSNLIALLDTLSSVLCSLRINEPLTHTDGDSIYSFLSVEKEDKDNIM